MRRTRVDVEHHFQRKFFRSDNFLKLRKNDNGLGKFMYKYKISSFGFGSEIFVLVILESKNNRHIDYLNSFRRTKTMFFIYLYVLIKKRLVFRL